VDISTKNVFDNIYQRHSHWIHKYDWNNSQYNSS